MVYEDEAAVAFMDTRPVNAGHLLVVPRAHAASLSDMDAASAAHLMAEPHVVQLEADDCFGVPRFFMFGISMTA
jgi:diadenosine tetraphosphate (Ap4A) HIT family hydrolase